MEIYSTETYEKLAIQPITQKELKTSQGRLNVLGWKNKLQTGDAVIVKQISTSKKENTVEFFYVSEEDYHKYKSIFNFKTIDTSNLSIKDGLFVRWRWDEKKYGFSRVNRFGDTKPICNTVMWDLEYVCRIYRNENFKYPLTDRYFQDNQNLVFALSHGWSLIYNYNHQPKMVIEKLNIQPVSKERLQATKNKFVYIGDKIWTAENASILTANDGTPLKRGVDYFEENGEIYYTYDAAMRIVPSGWRLPTKDDYNSLANDTENNVLNIISKDYGGTDKYGFNVKLVGTHTKARVIGKDLYVTLAYDYDKFGIDEPDIIKGLKIAGSKLKDGGVAFSKKIPSKYGMSVRFVRDKNKQI